MGQAIVPISLVSAGGVSYLYNLCLGKKAENK